MKLITIAVSHYCEKARWALDRAGIEYREERHLPLFHSWPVYRAGGESTPLLVKEGGNLTDSTDILRWIDEQLPEPAKLYPSDPRVRKEVEELEDEFDEVFGVCGRAWMYSFMLTEPAVIAKYSARHGIPWYEYKFLPVVFPFVRRFIVKSLELEKTDREESLRAVEATMNRVAERLADGRKFLAGDRFSAADLTFAALSAPILIPESYGVSLPSIDELPAEMRRQVESWRRHPAGAFARGLIEKYRFVKTPEAAAASARH